MPSAQPTKFGKSRKNLKGSKSTQINCGSMAPSISSSPTVGKKTKASKAPKAEKKAKQMKKAFNARTRTINVAKTKSPKATKSPNAKTRASNGTKSPNARKFIGGTKAPSLQGTSVRTNVPVLGSDEESNLSRDSSVLKKWRTKANRLLKVFIK